MKARRTYLLHGLGFVWKHPHTLDDSDHKAISAMQSASLNSAKHQAESLLFGGGLCNIVKGMSIYIGFIIAEFY